MTAEPRIGGAAVSNVGGTPERRGSAAAGQGEGDIAGRVGPRPRDGEAGLVELLAHSLGTELRRDLDPDLLTRRELELQADTRHPLAWGMKPETHGFFSNNPFFHVEAPFPSQEVSVAVRYPNEGLRASGWLRGEEHLAAEAAAVEVRFLPFDEEEEVGSLVLLGLRPQHRAQTHATFKLLFNALVNGG